jgi:hypothetical protein
MCVSLRWAFKGGMGLLIGAVCSSGTGASASANVREYWVAAVPVTWNVVPSGHDAIGGTSYLTADTRSR